MSYLAWMLKVGGVCTYFLNLRRFKIGVGAIFESPGASSTRTGIGGSRPWQAYGILRASRQPSQFPHAVGFFYHLQLRLDVFLHALYVGDDADGFAVGF